MPHIVESDPAALEAVREDVAELAKLILSDTTSRRDRFQAAGEIDWKLRQSTGIAKAPYVAAFVKMLLETENKLVLFGWHRDVYDIWMDLLAEYHPVLYTGSESPAQKEKAEEKFATDPSARVLIKSLRSGAGVDGLQEHARVAVFGELDWSPKVHDQRIGRLERDGMDENDPVVAYFLHTVDGADPAILERLDLKTQQSDTIVNPDAALVVPTAPDPDRARALATAFLESVGRANRPAAPAATSGAVPAKVTETVVLPRCGTGRCGGAIYAGVKEGQPVGWWTHDLLDELTEQRGVRIIHRRC